MNIVLAMLVHSYKSPDFQVSEVTIEWKSERDGMWRRDT
jgi:hypothetical protein